jgi:outer membrane protein assembly factor BamB
VIGERVFVTETRDKTTEVIRALDRATGRELWKASWPGAVTVPSYARGNGEWIRATPACDGQSLFVAGMRDVLVCLDVATGKERWRVDFVDRYQTPVPPYGFVCSPLVDGDYVYVQAAAGLCKLDKHRGKVLWRVLTYKSTPNGTAVSSPILATVAGKRQLLVQHPRMLAGVDPQNGELLWSAEVPAFRNINIITPTLHNDDVLTSAFGGRTILFHVRAQGGRLEAAAIWNTKDQGYMSSPVIVNGFAYMHLRNQRVTCLDLKSGKEAWTTERRFGRYWSMVAQKDRILALDQDGTLYLLRADPRRFDLIDSYKTGEEETWAHLALAGDQLFVRSLNAVAAFRWRSQKGAGKMP